MPQGIVAPGTAVSLAGFAIAVVFGGLSYVSYSLSRRLYGDGLAPLGLFLGVTFASLSLLSLDLLRLEALTSSAFAIIGLGIIAFVLGSVLATPQTERGAGVRMRRRSFVSPNPASRRGLKLFYYATGGLSTFGWLLAAYRLERSGSAFRLYLEQPYLLQTAFQQQYIGFLNVLGILVPPTFVLLTMARRRVSLPSLLFLVSAVTGLALSGVKSYVVFSLVTSLLVWSTARREPVRPAHVALFAAIPIGFMAIYDRVVDVFVSTSFPGSRFPEALSFLERPYLYIVGSWPAMSAMIEAPPKQAVPGLVTLSALWKTLGSGLGLVERVDEVEPFFSVGPTDFNVYSFIGGAYWDFGVIGVVVACALLGYIGTRLYARAATSSDWRSLLLSGVFSYGIFLSYFLYYYRFNMVFLLVYVAIVAPTASRVDVLWSRRRRGRSRSREGHLADLQRA